MSRLENIGFYTLCNERAKHASGSSPLWRCELILTDNCNFNCPYCRGPKHKRAKSLPFDFAVSVVGQWARDGLRNIRFSGGEPTTYGRLGDLVIAAKGWGVRRVAVSTNGSAELDYYKRLIALGVDDISISLDAAAPCLGAEMAGISEDRWEHVVDNIRELSRVTYVTTGMVFSERNADQAAEAVRFAASLGVRDIRVLSSAQYNQALEGLCALPDSFLTQYPILRYRVERFRAGLGVRGLNGCDPNRCRLVLDDMAIAGEHHFPCIIYLREGGDPIGLVGDDMRQQRIAWAETHDTGADPICRANCLDVCVDYNRQAVRFLHETQPEPCKVTEGNHE